MIKFLRHLLCWHDFGPWEKVGQEMWARKCVSMTNEPLELIKVRAELTALKADAMALATLVNAYAGNLDLLKQMQELSRRVLVATRRTE